jgi:hypothetical protein
VELRFELITSGFDTMLNHHLSQNFKLIGRDEFNYLVNILTHMIIGVTNQEKY